MVAHACNPSIWEAETRGSRFADSLSYLVRPMMIGMADIFSNIALYFFLFGGTSDGTQGHSTSKLHLQPIFILYLKQGLTKLQRASLSS